MLNPASCAAEAASSRFPQPLICEIFSAHTSAGSERQEFLIEIFSELLRGRPESCLLLVGAGEAEPMLRKKAEDLGVAGASIFYGTSARVEQLMWFSAPIGGTVIYQNDLHVVIGLRQYALYTLAEILLHPVNRDDH